MRRGVERPSADGIQDPGKQRASKVRKPTPLAVGALQNGTVHPVAIAAALVAAAIHVWIFALESLWFMRPAVYRRFGIASEEQASVVRSFAYNQGFYNLFLAIGVAAGLGLLATDNVAAASALVLFACGSMVAAGVVLVTHNRAFARAAAVQAVPPLVAIVSLLALR